MKKIVTIICAAAICSILPLQAQRFLGDIMVEHAKAPGIVHFNDGTEEEYAEIHIPCAAEKTFVVKDGKNKYKFASDDVAYLEIWNKAKPDSRWVIVYMKPYPKSKLKLWMVPVAKGEYAIAYKSSLTYNVDEDGSLIFISRGPTTLCIFKIPSGEDLPSFSMKDVLKFFGDDPDLKEKLEKKEIKVTIDYKYIVENYQPLAD